MEKNILIETVTTNRQNIEIMVISIKISKLVTCFYSFDLSCPILEKDNFIEHLYIVVLSY